jgi:hypothetical protein
MTVDLKNFLSGRANNRYAILALLTMGVTESIASGFMTTTDAVRIFFTGNNCLFVKKTLNDRAADEIMSRGVQLPDLFDILDPDEAAKELRKELRTIQELCQKLLHRAPVAA